jgi:hypothetical protein
LIVDHAEIHAPLLQTIYKVVFEEFPMERAVKFLMRYPVSADAEYLSL